MARYNFNRKPKPEPIRYIQNKPELPGDPNVNKVLKSVGLVGIDPLLFDTAVKKLCLSLLVEAYVSSFMTKNELIASIYLLLIFISLPKEDELTYIDINNLLYAYKDRIQIMFLRLTNTTKLSDEFVVFKNSLKKRSTKAGNYFVRFILDVYMLVNMSDTEDMSYPPLTNDICCREYSNPQWNTQWAKVKAIKMNYPLLVKNKLSVQK